MVSGPPCMIHNNLNSFELSILQSVQPVGDFKGSLLLLIILLLVLLILLLLLMLLLLLILLLILILPLLRQRDQYVERMQQSKINSVQPLVL